MPNSDKNFAGLRVLSLESRMAEPMRKLVERAGGLAFSAPSMREVPLEDNEDAFRFFEELEAGKFDLLILMTGVGLKALLAILDSRWPKERVLAGLAKAKVVVRGPKPLSVCRINKIPVAVTVPEPNTWHEILTILQEESMIAGQRIAVVEYGVSNQTFLEELKARGAQLRTLQVYRWGLPEDLAPLKAGLDKILAGEIDVLLFTNMAQVYHLLQIAAEKELPLRRALHRVALGSIGPTTSEALSETQLFADYEASPNKMADLVEQMAGVAGEIVERKRARAADSWIRIATPRLPAASELQNSRMMKACRREPVDRIPVWLMRQAGRYMAEYQRVRGGVDFLTLCKTPELAAQVTLDAAERLGVDAAIIFADILLLVEPMGVPLEFKESLGPVIGRPVRSAADIDQLKPVDPEAGLGFVLEAIRRVRREMSPKLPLIGFCGAPFTVAAYMIEGKGSRNYIPTKVLMREDPAAWHRLMEKITTASVAYLKAQVAAGCQILQVFDSWVGCLGPESYREFVLPHMKRLFSELPAGVPTIHFGTDTATLLELMKEAGGDVIGLDWRVDIASTWDRLGSVAVQGNFDPVLLFAKPEAIRAEAERLLAAVGSRPGYIFNLGHGILPETPVENVLTLVNFVHAWPLG
ncbi:MAG TPA: uroporphyrinogen decarboxylase [bacterium]|nr:uroporphyrinogen decarboxylase [bacterium]